MKKGQEVEKVINKQTKRIRHINGVEFDFKCTSRYNKTFNSPQEFLSDAYDYCERMLAIADQDGFLHAPSLTGFAAFLGISRQTLYNLKAKEKCEEMTDAYDLVCDLFKQMSINGGKSGMYKAMMVKAEYGLADRIDHTTKGEKIDAPGIEAYYEKRGVETKE